MALGTKARLFFALLIACSAFALFVILPVASALELQSAAVPQVPLPAAGSVTGHVDFDETKLPVRFAEIRLFPKPTDAAPTAVEDQTLTNPPKPHLQMVLGHTGFDGSFRMDGVPAGDYFAVALFPGYVAPGTSADAMVTEDQLERLIAMLPTVQVTAGLVANVDLTLRRGAVIAGRVWFADGSPATGVSVEWELADHNLAIQSVRLAIPSPSQQIMQSCQYYTYHDHRVVTDDEGRYRIFGLPPGNYIVSTVLPSQLTAAAQVTLSDGSSPSSSERRPLFPEMTLVYAPGVFRRNDAKVFEIRGSEQVMDADLKIDPSGMHTVRGRVLAGEDRHVPSQAMVRIKEDGGKDAGKFVMIEDDGSFQLDYILPGSYTLEVVGTETEIVDNPERRVSRSSYQLLKVAVVVGGHDVMLDDLLLTTLKPGEKMQYPE